MNFGLNYLRNFKENIDCLNNLDNTQLEFLRKSISSILDKEKNHKKDVIDLFFRIEFENNLSSEFKLPYVAKLTVKKVNEHNVISREFFRSERKSSFYNNKIIGIFEYYGEVNIGDILEIRALSNNSDSNSRQYYIVCNKELISIEYNKSLKHLLYLKYQKSISCEEFISRVLSAKDSFFDDGIAYNH